MKVKRESEVVQLCPTLRDPADCSLPGSSIHGISPARVLEWGAIAFSSSPITSWQIDGEKVEMVSDFIFWASKINVDGDCNHEIKILASWKNSYDKPRPHIKKQKHHLADKGPYSQNHVFSGSHVWM